MPKKRSNGRSRQERERLLTALADPVPPGGVGPRVVRTSQALSVVDPSEFRCTRLAAQLADEWVEYVAATAITAHAQTYRLAINRFCEHVDEALGPMAEITSLTDPQLFDVLVNWELSLPESYAPSSTYPSVLASG